MRALLSLLVLLALAIPLRAQEEGGDPKSPDEPRPEAGEEGAEGGDAKEEKGPEEPPVWTMPDRDRRKIEGLLEDYLYPRRSRQEAFDKFEKQVARDIDGHSALEDVTGFVSIAGKLRIFNPKLSGRRGKVQEIAVAPDVHGFPGKIGTVRYSLYVPKDYRDRELWPLIFCLPDNAKWNTKEPGEREKYIQETWVQNSPAVADGYIVVVPEPRAKGEDWVEEESMARAMIALRHVAGNFQMTDKKEAGPAVDVLRMYLDGNDSAAQVAARFAEMFVGAVLRHCTGEAGSGPNLRQVGGLNGLPACMVFDPASGTQKQFAQRVKAANDATLILEANDGDALGDANTVVAWMEKRPPKGPAERSIEFTVHDPSFQRHHWINVLEFDSSVEPAAGFLGFADRAANEVRIDVNGLTRFELFLNDALVDLNRPLRIIVIEGEKEYDVFPGGKETVSRSLGTMLQELIASNHPWRIYPAKLLIDVPALRQRAAEAEAAEAAGGGAAAGKPEGTAQGEAEPAGDKRGAAAPR